MDYQQKLRPVIRHLEQHFNQPLNLQDVAALANLSPYHFHRVFKAVTNETLNEYLRRLRLQQAARDLFHSKKTITAIAMDYGFSSSQNFSKCFRKYLGVSPGAIQRSKSLPEFYALLRGDGENSKIGNTQSKNGNDSITLAAYPACDSSTLHQFRSHSMKRQQFDSATLAYVRVTGPYGENYQPAVDKLYQWAGAEGVADSTCIFIYHDNPEITPAEKCRTDICLMIDKPVKISGDVELQEFAGGEYGTMRKTITDPSQYGPAWGEHIAEIVAMGLEMDERPCFELYHSYDQQKKIADVSFCSALK